MRFLEFKDKEVINMRDCKRLGRIWDIEMNPENGCIYQIIIPKSSKFCGIFGQEQEIVIDWKDICQIGEDIILVDMK